MYKCNILVSSNCTYLFMSLGRLLFFMNNVLCDEKYSDQINKIK